MSSIESDEVSRETESSSQPLPAAVSRETEHDTPIAREAAQAVHVMNVRQEQWPSPKKTRVLTVANQKGGV
ncbi:MAG: chromosome partitioning protein, partial [Actinobacteria bacterium]|nr:chromosome partitioning protein [Actinomycetota bacterium]